MSGPTSEDYATAYHEAAHAVAAVLLGVPADIDFVSIVEEGASCGRVRFEADGVPTKESVGDFIVQQLVGRFGQERRTGERVGLDADDDYYKAAEYAVFVKIAARGDFPGGPQLGQPFFLPFEECAIAFVEAHWDVIRRVAEELVVKKTLTGAEVEALVQR